MGLFGIEYDGKVIGCYDDINAAKDFIFACLQNNLMKNNKSVYILTYKINSCFYTNKTLIELPSSDTVNEKQFNNIIDVKDIESSTETETTNDDDTSSDDDSTNNTSSVDTKNIMMQYNPNDPQEVEIAKKKINMQHKINVIKCYKEKIQESQNVYDCDLKLYNNFKQNQMSDDQFSIPELFRGKYDVFEKLVSENKLSWDNFVQNFKHVNDYNEHFGLNDYEILFQQIKDDEDALNNIVVHNVDADDDNISENFTIDSIDDDNNDDNDVNNDNIN